MNISTRTKQAEAISKYCEPIECHSAPFQLSSSGISGTTHLNEEPGDCLFQSILQLLGTSGISRVLKYSVRYLTEYSSSKKLYWHITKCTCMHKLAQPTLCWRKFPQMKDADITR